MIKNKKEFNILFILKCFAQYEVNSAFKVNPQSFTNSALKGQHVWFELIIIKVRHHAEFPNKIREDLMN